MFLSLNNFIHILFHSILNVVNPPTPESMLFVVKERLEGLKHNFGLGGGGGSTLQGKGTGMSTVQKGAIL